MSVEFQWHVEGPAISSGTIDRERIRVRLFSVLVQAARHHLLTSRGWNDHAVRVKGLEEHFEVRVTRLSSKSLSVSCSFDYEHDESKEFVEQFLAESIVEMHRLSWAEAPATSNWHVSDLSNYLERLISRLEDHSGGVERMSFQLSSPHAHQRFDLDRTRVRRLSVNLHRLVRKWIDAKHLDLSPGVSALPPSTLNSFFNAITESQTDAGRGTLHRTDTPDRSSGDVIEGLRSAAISGEEPFLKAMANIEFEGLAPDTKNEVVQLAVAASAYSLARKLALEGASLHPDHPGLKKMADILRPPEYSRVPWKNDSSIGANNAWLRDHAEKYRGEWVALRNGQLLAHGATAIALKNQIGDLSDTLVTKIAA